MPASDAVTFSLPGGARVTAHADLARKLGWSEPVESKPDPKPAPKRRAAASKKKN